jgi:hypothetical protein
MSNKTDAIAALAAVVHGAWADASRTLIDGLTPEHQQAMFASDLAAYVRRHHDAACQAADEDYFDNDVDAQVCAVWRAIHYHEVAELADIVAAQVAGGDENHAQVVSDEMRAYLGTILFASYENLYV